MKAKTYNDYYNILLKGCKEAFKAIELKEFLYTDEAMEDNKEYFISKESIEQIGINRSNNLIVNYQIEKDIKIDFIRFLDRQQQLFEKKHLIPRNEFYKKCELITSHVGRRSFCTNFYGTIPTTYLMNVSGHSTEQMFLTYLGKSNKDLAMEITNYF